MTAREILPLLKHVRPRSDGWVACCPAHADSNPSLSVRESKDRVLLHCHAGCSPLAVANALGIEMSDLFLQADPQPKIAKTYPYRDEHGNLLFEVVRYDPKSFKQRRPDGRSGWTWNLNGTRRVLFDLPEILKADLVLVCEGEKDCETAQTLGFVATCNPGGAGKWRPEYSGSLKGKRIVIIPDLDEPGRKHARDVARAVISVAQTVKIVELPSGKDLSEWAAPSGTGSAEELHALISDAPEITAKDIARWQPASPSAPAHGFQIATLGELMQEPDAVESWLVEGLLPTDGLSLLAAKPKVGKSTLARCLALAVARGEQFLGRTAAQGAVIYLALEEKRAEVRKHFLDLGADGTEPIYIHCAAAPQDALTELHDEIERHTPALVIIDPILRMTRVKDANDYAQVSNALEPLMSLARESGTHLLMVYHLGKGERADASESILGSTAFFAAVDTAVIMRRLEHERTIQSRQRYGDDLAETVLNFDPERRAVSLGPQRSEAENKRVAEAILSFLRDSGEAKTEQEVDGAVEGRNAAKRTALRQLVEEDKVKRQGSGRRGSPYTYELPYSCTPDIPGTRVQETTQDGDSSMNTGQNLVPSYDGLPKSKPH